MVLRWKAEGSEEEAVAVEENKAAADGNREVMAV